MPPEPRGPSAARVETRALVSLALPLAAGFAGNQLISFVSTAMVGRLGATSLGAVGIGNGLFMALTLLGMGCVIGMEAPIAQALGAGETARARRLLWQGVRVALAVGVPLTALVGVIPAILRPVGVAPAIADEVRLYLLGRLPNVIPFLLYVAQRSYLQAVGATRPIVIAVVVANVGNLLANLLLIWGDGGLAVAGLPAIGMPALGILGSGLAASVAMLLSAIVLGVALLAVPAPPDPARRRPDPAAIRTILRLGLPVGVQWLAEVGIFAIAAVLAGRMGEHAAAGHQVAITLASFTFTVVLGVSSAAAVRVGKHVGAGDTPSARRAGLLAIALGAGVMSGFALLFVLVPGLLARLLTDEAPVIAAAAPLVMIAAVFQLSDGVQAVSAGALRGAGDAIFPLVTNLVCHYGISLPVALALGVFAGLGAPGLWWGLCAGLTAVALTLALRFVALSRRPIARV